MSSYFSYAEQARHYFNRPHEAPLREPLDTVAAWHGPELAQSDAWCERLSEAQVDELDRALAHAKATSKPTRELGAADFPLPTLSKDIARWRGQTETGRGFQVISGFPVERWGDGDSGVFFWCFGLHMGRPGAQNPQGDLLGHVVDTGDDAVDPGQDHGGEPRTAPEQTSPTTATPPTSWVSCACAVPRRAANRAS